MPKKQPQQNVRPGRPSRPARTSKPSAKLKDAKIDEPAAKAAASSDIDQAEEEFEYALLEGCGLAFPITDGRKLTKYQEKLQRIARNKRVDEYAMRGASIRDISKKMAAEGWQCVSRPNIFKILVANLNIVAKDAALSTLQRKQLELNKLEQAEMAHFHRFLRETNPDATEKLSRVVERIWKRRDMLEGRTQKVEVTGQDGGPVELSTVTRVIFPTAVPGGVGSDEDEDRNENGGNSGE